MFGLQGRKRWLPVALQIALIFAFVIPATRSAMRDNDQASLVTGALQIKAHQVSGWHNSLYNYDKQYGTFLLLALAYKALPHVDPTAAGNMLLVVLYGVGSVVALLAAARCGLPAWVGTVLVLTPSMIFYAPFLGSSQVSLALLLLSFPFLQKRTGKGFYAGVVLLAVATTMRVDTLFCVPAIYTAITARKTLRQIIADYKFWSLIAAVAAPLLAGRWMVPKPTPNEAVHFFIPSYIAAMLVFAIGLPWLACSAIYTGHGLKAALGRKRWMLFYGFSVLSLWWGLAYYSVQFYSARYFFPTFFSSLILLSSRRGRLWLRAPLSAGLNRWVIASLIGLSVLPWLVGVHLKSRKTAQLSLLHETDIPTSDGLLPMGSYAAFEARMMQNRDIVDHNQEILLSARSVHYLPCSGVVQVFGTPMSNYLEEVAEEQGYPATLVTTDKPSNCHAIYLDMRSMMRNDVSLDWIFQHAMHWESQAGEVQPILSVDGDNAPNALTSWVKAAVEEAHGLDARHYRANAVEGSSTLKIPPGVSTVLYSATPSCLPDGDSRAGFTWKRIPSQPTERNITVCSDQQGGWFLGALPDFLQKTN